MFSFRDYLCIQKLLRNFLCESELAIFSRIVVKYIRTRSNFSASPNCNFHRTNFSMTQRLTNL